MIQLYVTALDELESALDQVALTLTDMLWELDYDEIDWILETDLAPLSDGNSLSHTKVQVYLFGLLKAGKIEEMRRIAQEIDENRAAQEDEDENEEDTEDEPEQDETE